MSEEEVWKPVTGYEGLYEVSNRGMVRSLDRIVNSRWGKPVLRKGKILSLNQHRDGHLRIALRDQGVSRLFYVHRLVALEFVDNPDDLPLVRHWDDDPSNNLASNLRWGTVSDNWNDMVRNGSHRNARKTHCPKCHEYTEENTYRDKKNRRQCRQCNREARQKVREDLLSDPLHRFHGTKTGDSYGCSCPRCREAKRMARRNG